MQTPELPDDLALLIRRPFEVRTVEYKQSMAWDEARFKIVKAALGFSNIPDGGRLIVGVSEGPRGVYVAEGMNERHFDSYVQDNVNDFVNEYADPSMSISVHKGMVDGSRYVVIAVPPFRELPTLCKRDGGTRELRRGAIYTRSIHKPETAEVRDQTEMREIMDRATMLAVRKMQRLYPEIFERPESVSEILDRELGEFL